MTTPDPAGWYDDPHDPSAQRYWDGGEWTGRVKPKPVGQSASQRVVLPPLPGQHVQAPIPPRTSRTNPVALLAVIGAVVLVLVVAVIGFNALFGGTDSDTAPDTARGPDEIEIEQLVHEWTDDLNNRDLEGLQSLMCAGSAAQLPQDVFYGVEHMGELSSDVSNIVVVGSTATAGIVSNWANGTHNASSDTYAKENGVWKICHTINF